MKNWRNPRHYRSTEKLDGRRLAWQFLRRNQDYKAAWEAALEAKQSEWERNRSKGSSGQGKSSQRRIADPDDPSFALESPECAPRWGILRYRNPASFMPPVFVSARGFFLPGSLMIGGSVKLPDQLEVCAAIVDCSQDLAWQLKRIKQSAKELRSLLKEAGEIGRTQRQGKRKGDWALYLRLLDAAAVKADRLEMARVLFPKLYGGVKPPPAKPAKRNTALMEREAQEARMRSEALAKVRSTLKQAKAWTMPDGYLKLLARLA